MADPNHGSASGSSTDGVLSAFWGGTSQQSSRTVNAKNNLVDYQSYYFGRFSTRPLAAQTIPAQSWSYQAAVGETSVNSNTYFWPVMYVWRPSIGEVVEPYIFDAAADTGNEWPQTLSVVAQSFTGAQVTIQEGDILVVECWGAGKQTTTGGTYLQSWRITAPTSKIVSPYKLEYPPNSTLWFTTTVASIAPSGVDNASSLPLGTHTSAAGSATEYLWSEVAPNDTNQLSRAANQQSALSTPQSLYMGRYSTLPLAAQVIPAQTWSWEASTGETSDNANTFFWPVMYVWRPSPGVVVDHVFDAAGPSGLEWRILDDPRLDQQFVGESVTTQDGDILVVEIWGVGTQSVAGTYAHRLWTNSFNSRIVSPYKLTYYVSSVDLVAVPTLTETQILFAPLPRTLFTGSTGWLNPSTSGSISGTWSNLGNVYLSDDTYATASVPGSFGSVNAKFAGFGVDIASNAAIRGVEARFEAKRGTAGLLAYLHLSYNTSLAGTGNITLSQNAISTSLTASDAVYSGGATTGWPVTYWNSFSSNGSTYTYTPTTSDINNEDFGVRFQAFNSGGAAETVSLDHVQINVHYFVDLTPGAAIEVDPKAFVQTFLAVAVNAKEIVAVPKLTQVQTFNSVSINEAVRVAIDTKAFTQTLFAPAVAEYLPVPKLTQVQTFRDVNINAREAVPVPKLTQVQTFRDVNINAREVVPVTKLTEVQTFRDVNINEGQTAPIFTYIQTFRDVNINAREVVPVTKLTETQTFLAVNINALERIAVPTLNKVQTFLAVNVNAREIVPVTKLTETQSLYAPNINVHDRVSVPKLTETQTFLDLNISAKDVVAIPRLIETQTLWLPKLNEALVVSTKAFTQTLRAPAIREVEYPPQLAFTQTLYDPETLEENQIAPDSALAVTQTLLDVEVNARDVVRVDRLIETQTFYSLRLVDVVRIDSLPVVQTFRAVNINAREHILVPKLTEVQSFKDVNVNAAGAEPIPRLAQTQTFRDVNINARDKVAVPRLIETQSLHAPNVSVLSLIVVPKLTFNEVLYAPGVNAREGLAVAVKAFVETLYTPNINVGERIIVPKLTQTQTFYDVKLSAVVQVTTRTFVQTLYVPTINQPATVFITGRHFIQTLYAPSTMAIEVIEIVVSGTTEIKVTVLAEKQVDVAVLSNPLKGIVV